MSAPIKPEELLSHKWDRCLADYTVNTLTGAAVGVVTSAVLFKRRAWPVALGAGIGIGSAYEKCARSFVPIAPASVLAPPLPSRAA
ncbi:hypothetical protein CXG81DRAFT_26486 [Caulochytrium protostelioides]|uniref:MICOS complex subunit MIC10 n=2 Tax=Caulochytrium protostelioides TaxID=1555241 RepID=A0A4P9X6M7_9FUNG|nr:hypothetical protein CXG81DRAFT_26486 [Caulochytrium protostelioides]|eukprot:RKP00822.1 hypothetical protein CXG81DRAFT_26486 [Caulochytrium protostelioides]